MSKTASIFTLVLGAVCALGCAHDKASGGEPKAAEAPAAAAAKPAPGTCAPAGGAQAAPQGKYAIRLKLVSGEVRRYTMELNVHTKVLANDAPMMDMPMKMKFVQIYEVGGPGAGGAIVLKQRFEDFDIAAEGPMGEMMKQLAQGMNKVTVTAQVCPDGSIASSKVEGADRPELESLANQMAQGGRFSFLPKTPVGPGDTWTTEETSEVGGMGGSSKAVVKSTLKFVAVEACGAKQCAHVESESETSSGESGDSSGSGKGHSTLLIELDTGRLNHSKGAQEAKYQGSQQGQHYDVQSSVSYTSELK
jgi:hypothetical protein